MDENKDRGLFRKSQSSSPTDLLASVLEQRYAHKSNSVVKNKDEKPDPMTFPAVQKALGSMYSTIVEIVEEQEEEGEIPLQAETENESENSVDAIEIARGMNIRLLDMVDEIEQGEKQREAERKAVTIEVQRKRADPYNREYNSYFQEPDEIDTIDISSQMDIETIVSSKKKTGNKRFRNEA